MRGQRIGEGRETTRMERPVKSPFSGQFFSIFYLLLFFCLTGSSMDHKQVTYLLNKQVQISKLDIFNKQVGFDFRLCRLDLFIPDTTRFPFLLSKQKTIIIINGIINSRSSSNKSNARNNSSLSSICSICCTYRLSLKSTSSQAEGALANQALAIPVDPVSIETLAARATAILQQIQRPY